MQKVLLSKGANEFLLQSGLGEEEEGLCTIRRLKLPLEPGKGYQLRKYEVREGNEATRTYHERIKEEIGCFALVTLFDEKGVELPQSTWRFWEKEAL